MSGVQEGQIITFYSYKGGTGRTMALANTAWILASTGRKVLTIDWDLESPGLHKFFHPFLTAGISDMPGVIEMIQEYAWAAVLDEPRSDDWHKEYAQVSPYVTTLKWSEFPGEGRLDFMSAGRQNRDYSSLIGSFDWDHFWEQLGGGLFFNALRADVKQNYDYVLIDSRTGLSDIAEICTMHLPDALVDCFTLSDQSIEGAANVARDVSRADTRNIEIFPVPMRIEEGEKEKLDAGRAYAWSKFDKFLSGAGKPILIATGRPWRSPTSSSTPSRRPSPPSATFPDRRGRCSRPTRASRKSSPRARSVLRRSTRSSDRATEVCSPGSGRSPPVTSS
ncbi:hypothetical protein AB0B89_06385 [Sphaerisporangium sp. NPDC049002]|uniref:tyrosine-protein kinase family protein n=1 Tax=unclassified Sphaerisporangium TaxID=2630420 RepID=UPI0033FBB864